MLEDWQGMGSVGAYGSLYPGDILAEVCVDSWARSRATGVNTPRKDALQGLVTDKRATGVTLAGVPPLVQTRTHHVAGEHARIEDLTLLRTQDSDRGAAQAPVVLHSSGDCGAPASNLALVPRLGTAVGQAQGLEARPQHGGPGQLQQHEVVLVGPPRQNRA